MKIKWLGSRNPEDDELIERLKGDQVAFERAAASLYKQHLSFTYQASGKYPNLPREAILDSYHDAIDAVIKKIIQNDFDPSQGKISTLLYQIFFNKCVDQLRSFTNHKSKWERDLAELHPELPVRSQNFLRRIMEEEDFHGVSQAMQALKPPCRELILDLDYWGFSPEEAANRNGYKNGHSASQAKYRCLEHLRKKLRTE